MTVHSCTDSLSVSVHLLHLVVLFSDLTFPTPTLSIGRPFLSISLYLCLSSRSPFSLLFAFSHSVVPQHSQDILSRSGVKPLSIHNVTDRSGLFEDDLLLLRPPVAAWDSGLRSVCTCLCNRR